MKCLSVLWVLLIMLFVSNSSCLSTKKPGTNTREVPAEPVMELPEAAYTVVPDTFVLPPIPEDITATGERAAYLAMHFWDKFDFANRKLIARPEITEQAFVDYINILDHAEDHADASLLYTLQKASIDTVMYQHFTTLFEKYFYDPNSPFRNEEFYIPVLQELTRSSLLSEERKSVLQFQLDMALKNRVGEKANNFIYTLPSGQSYGLYDLKSEYTLLMFSNPGCSTCGEVIERLNLSKEVNRALSLNSPGRTMLTILTIYPDEELSEWLAYLDRMPGTWVHGYDKGIKITREKLYDIKAIPTIYLLDKEKKVILKDSSIEAVEAFFHVGG